MAPTQVFSPGRFYGQRSLVGFSPWGSQTVGHDWAFKPMKNNSHNISATGHSVFVLVSIEIGTQQLKIKFAVCICYCSIAQSCLFLTPWTAARQASLSFTISQSLLKLMSVESEMPSNHLVLRCPLLFLSSVFPTIRVFSSKSVLHIRWPKYWSFNFSISPSNEYSWLISFRIDRFDLLAVQETLKSLIQHHSLKASVLRHSAFFMVQLSHPYMTIGKTIALTRWTFIGKVMFLLVQVCHNFSSKEQASFNFMAAVTIFSDFGAPQNKVWHCFHCFPIYLPWSDDGTRCHDLRFLNVEF